MPAYGQFTVMQSLIDIDDDVADNKALLDESAGIVKGVKQQVDNVPDSPAKSQMETKLDELDEAIKTATSNTAHLPNVLQPYKTLVQQRPDAEPSLQPFFDHLAQLDIQAQQAKETYAKQIAQSKNGVKTCDAIDQATQALRAVPDMIEIAKKPWQFAAAFGTNMAQSELPASAGPARRPWQPREEPSDRRRQADGEPGRERTRDGIGERDRREAGGEHSRIGSRHAGVRVRRHRDQEVRAQRRGGHQGPLDLLDKATSLAGDLVAYANERLFAQYCEKFQAASRPPCSRTSTVNPTAKGSQPNGGPTPPPSRHARAPLPQGGNGQGGRAERADRGGATRFTYKENVFSTDLYGSMAKAERCT